MVPDQPAQILALRDELTSRPFRRPGAKVARPARRGRRPRPGGRRHLVRDRSEKCRHGAGPKPARTTRGRRHGTIPWSAAAVWGRARTNLAASPRRLWDGELRPSARCARANSLRSAPRVFEDIRHHRDPLRVVTSLLSAATHRARWFGVLITGGTEVCRELNDHPAAAGQAGPELGCPTAEPAVSGLLPPACDGLPLGTVFA